MFNFPTTFLSLGEDKGAATLLSVNSIFSKLVLAKSSSLVVGGRTKAVQQAGLHPLHPPARHGCPQLRKKIVLGGSFQLEELTETEKEEYLLKDFLRKDFNVSHTA